MSGGNKGDQFQAKLRGNILSHPVYSDGTNVAAIQRGTMVMITSAGFALQGADTSGAFFAGISEEAIAAHLSTQAAAPNIRVRRKGIFKMKVKTAANAPTLVGDLVYIDTAQGVAGGNDESVDVTAGVTNHVLVGKIVKHGTDTQAKAATSTDDVWVDIMGVQHTVLGDATYPTLTNAASHDTGKGAELVGVEENVGWGATPTLQDALELMLTFGHIPIPLASFFAGDAAPLAIQTSTEPGYEILSSKELTIAYPDDGAASDLMFGAIPIPGDFDETAGFTVHFLAEKSGNNNADLTFDLLIYMAGVAQSNLADINDTTIITMANVATTIEELVFTCGADVTNLIAPPASLNGIVTIVTAGTDHVNIHAAWIEYTRKFA